MRKTAILFWLFCSILLITVLAACAAFEDPSQRATENAQNTALWTMVYDFQTQKPSIEAMEQTANAAVVMSTQLANTSNENQNLRATNSALIAAGARQPGNNTFGSNPTAVGGGQPAGAVPTSSVSQSGAPGGTVFSTATPMPASGSNPGAGSSAGSTTVTGITTSGARFTRSVTSTGRTEDGCAQGIQNTFSQNAESIFFTSEVRDITPGIAFSLRVNIQDEGSSSRTVGSDPNFWIADTDYDETCVWYNIDRATMIFNPGTYTVEFLADGEVGARATFVITAASNAPAATTEGASAGGAATQ
jgi:hypothetical protein